MDALSNVKDEVSLVNSGEVISKKKDLKGIQKWIDSISTSQDGQETTNKETVSFGKVPCKKSCVNDDLLINDEANSTSLKDHTNTNNTCKNFFQQIMRKKFSDRVTGASFNSDATSDSFQMILDSRQKSAELILRNLGFCVPLPCKEMGRVVPERFFREPSAANGISSSIPLAKNPEPSLEESRDTMTEAMKKLIRLISMEKSTKNGDNDTDDDDADGRDGFDGTDRHVEETESTGDGILLIDTIKELFLSKLNSIGVGGISTNASGSPPGMFQDGCQVIRPSLKVSHSGARYWTILQPDNTEYLDSVGYYDTMPSITEPCQNPHLEEQFTNALARLQQIGKKKKILERPTLADNEGTEVDQLNPASHIFHSSNSEGAKVEADDGESDSPSPNKKIMTVPSRFLQTPSLLGNVSHFMPNSSTTNEQNGTHEDSISLESLRRNHPHHFLHRQSSVFSDQLMKEFEDDAPNDDHRNQSDITFRFSDSSYSCGDSSCSSLPRDLELERYYASKNMLRIPTAESDDVASCISDHTAVNENVARIPSTSEGAEGAQHAGKPDVVLPNLSDLKKKLKARMTRQTSSQSDSSGFGDSEFVDALTHQQIHSTGKLSSVGPFPHLNDIGRSSTFDLAPSSEQELSLKDQGVLSQSLGNLCPSCSKNQDTLKMEAWSQTSLTCFKRDERSGINQDPCSSFRSEVMLDNGGDRVLGIAPFGSEVCLLIRDEPSMPRASTTLNIRVSRPHLPGRRHSYNEQNAPFEDIENKQHLVYQLLSTDNYLERRQSLPALRSRQDYISSNQVSHPNHFNWSHHHNNIYELSSSCSSLHHSYQMALRCRGSNQHLGNDRQQLMERASQMLCLAHSQEEEIKRMQSEPGNGTHGLFQLSNDKSLYDEVLKRLHSIHCNLLEWCKIILGGEREDGNEEQELRDFSLQLNAVDNVIRTMKRNNCQDNHNHDIYQHQQQGALFSSPPQVDAITSLSSLSAPLRPEQRSFLKMPNLQSSNLFSSNEVSSTLTDRSMELDLENIKKQLKDLEEKFELQQEHQELTLRLIFKEFKDSLIKEFKEMKTNIL